MKLATWKRLRRTLPIAIGAIEDEVGSVISDGDDARTMRHVNVSFAIAALARAADAAIARRLGRTIEMAAESACRAARALDLDEASTGELVRTRAARGAALRPSPDAIAAAASLAATMSRDALVDLLGRCSEV